MQINKIMVASLLGCLTVVMPQLSSTQVLPSIGTEARPQASQPVESATRGSNVEDVTTTLWMLNAPSTPPPPHPKILRPVLGHNIDTNHLDNLVGKSHLDLYHREAPSGQPNHQTAVVSLDYLENPAVLLENSEHIKSIKCLGNGIMLSFSNRTAYNHAYHNWNEHPGGITLISFRSECGPGHARGQHDYLHARGLQADDTSMTITVDGDYEDIAQALGSNTTVTAKLGSLQPQPEKRGSIGNILSRVASDAQGGARDVKTHAQAMFSSELAELHTTKGFTSTHTWDAEPTGSVDAGEAWGRSRKLFSNKDTRVDCVGCRANGSTIIDGTIAFKGNGFKPTEANIHVSGDMEVTVAIGLDGTVGHGFNIGSIPLFHIPLTPISIIGFLYVGPTIGVDFGAAINVAANGRLEMGAKLSWPDFSFEADGVAKSMGKHDGILPKVEPIYSVNGSVSASLDLQLPISAGVGLDIALIKWEEQLQLVNTVGMELGVNFSDQEPCKGTDLFINLSDEVGVDVFGLTSISLASTSTSLYNRCISSS